MYEMTSPKKRPHPAYLVGFLLSIALVFQAATQFVAHQLQYQKALGEPLIGHVYAPWAWLSWRFSFYDQLPRFFDQVGLAVNGVIEDEVYFGIVMVLFSIVIVGFTRVKAEYKTAG